MRGTGMNGPDQLQEEIIQLKEKLNDMFVQHYWESEIFTPTWWISIALAIVPIFIWWKVVDKKRLLEMSVFGLLVNVIATFLDIGLSDHMMWEYPVRILPQMALLLPVDYVIIPVAGTILYQKFPKWRHFLMACTATSAFMSFVCEPIAVYIGMYRLLTWRYIYSFPIYIAIYAIIKFVTEKAVARTNSERNRIKD